MPLPKSYIDWLDKEIFSFQSDPNWKERYPANCLKVESKEFFQELSMAGEKMFHVFNKAALSACNTELAYSVLGLDRKLLEFMLTKYNLFGFCSFISRLDFLLDKDNNLKLLEINADTPCAVVESYYGNKIACSFFDKDNPNGPYAEDIRKIFTDIITLYSMAGYAVDNVCFSAHDAYKEDTDTAKYLMNNSGIDAFYAPLKDLIVKDDGLYAQGRKIDVLYRLHPMEMLIEDKDFDGYPTGEALLNLVKNKKLVLINPPEAIMMQIKSLYAYIWQQKDSDMFTNEEKATIRKYMLPTYFDAYNFSGSTFVKKPIYGREGADIEIIDKEYYVVASTSQDGAEVPSIYQEFCETPLVDCMTDSGYHSGRLTYSVFNLLGKSSAFFCRFDDDLIASKDSFWLPLGMDKANRGL